MRAHFRNIFVAGSDDPDIFPLAFNVDDLGEKDIDPPFLNRDKNEVPRFGRGPRMRGGFLCRADFRNGRQEPLEFDRFQEVICYVKIEAFNGILVLRCRNNDGSGTRQGSKKGHTLWLGKMDIEEDEVGGSVGQEFGREEGIPASRREADAAARGPTAIFCWASTGSVQQKYVTRCSPATYAPNRAGSGCRFIRR